MSREPEVAYSVRLAESQDSSASRFRSYLAKLPRGLDSLPLSKLRLELLFASLLSLRHRCTLLPRGRVYKMF